MTDTTKKLRKRKPTGPFSNELLDQLLAQAAGRNAEGLLGESGLIGQLKKQLAERMLATELTHHLKLCAYKRPFSIETSPVFR